MPPDETYRVVDDDGSSKSILYTANACKISLVSQDKMTSQCIRIASTDILNFLGGGPPPPSYPEPSTLGKRIRRSMAVPHFKSRRRPCTTLLFFAFFAFRAPTCQ